MNGRPEAALRTERRAGIYVGHLGDLLGDLGAQRAGCSGDLAARRVACAARKVACAARVVARAVRGVLLARQIG